MAGPSVVITKVLAQAPASTVFSGGIALFTGSPKIKEILEQPCSEQGWVHTQDLLSCLLPPPQWPHLVDPGPPCVRASVGGRTRGCGTVEGDPVDRSDRTDSQRERDMRPTRKGVWGLERWEGREIIPGFRAD